MRTADPDVHIKATGLLVCSEIPSPKNAADRSSITVCVQIEGCLFAATINGVLRLPGERTMSSMPWATKRSIINLHGSLSVVFTLSSV